MATSRAEAVAILREGQAKLEELVSGLPNEELEKPGTVGGGWSAKDLIGHIATWEEVALGALEEFRRGEIPFPERPEGPFAPPGTASVDAFNARTIEEKRRLSLDEVRARAQAVHRDLVAAIESLSDEEWKAKAFYPTPNNRRRHLHTLLGSVLGAPKGPFRHAFAHMPDLEVFASSVR